MLVKSRILAKVKRVVIAMALMLAGAMVLAGQERREQLEASKVRARAGWRIRMMMPSLGLPERTDGGHDAAVFLKGRLWYGADSLNAVPHWVMWEMEPGTAGAISDGINSANSSIPVPIAPFVKEFRRWCEEKPSARVAVVCGRLASGWYIAGCRRTRSRLGWKAIAFEIPFGTTLESAVIADPIGNLSAGKSDLYSYSMSINRVESISGYNLFPGLPPIIQEIVEEMTASELLCPFIEYDRPEMDGPDRGLDSDLLLELIHDAD